MANDATFKFGADVIDIKNKLNSIDKRLEKTGKAASNLFNAAAGTALASGLVMAAKHATKTAAAFEQTKVAFETMLGSGEKADRLLSSLLEFSTVTPFEPVQVFEASKKLLGFGFKADEVTGILQKLGDVSAGTGKDFNELAMIFGKVFTKGKAQGEELNQMAEAGIPIIQELAEMYDTTGEAIFDMASKGKISFDDINKAFTNMTEEGGRFNGMMEKQSQTLNGTLSTLSGNIDEIAKGIGNKALPFLKLLAKEANSAALSFKDMEQASKNIGTDKTTGTYAETGASSVRFMLDYLTLGFGSDLIEQAGAAVKGGSSEMLSIPAPTNIDRQLHQAKKDNDKKEKIQKEEEESFKKNNQDLQNALQAHADEQDKIAEKQAKADAKAAKEKLKQQKEEEKKEKVRIKTIDDQTESLMRGIKPEDSPLSRLEQIGAGFGGKDALNQRVWKDQLAELIKMNKQIKEITKDQELA